MKDMDPIFHEHFISLCDLFPKAEGPHSAYEMWR